MAENHSSYPYKDSGHNPAHAYLLPAILRILPKADFAGVGERKRIFEVGCGNGAIANALAGAGHEVIGVDSSEEGIAQANSAYPSLKLYRASAYDDLAGRFGTFPVVLSLEVVEHLAEPRKFAENIFKLLNPGGLAIISAPYHGYFKNLALSLSGKMDAHFAPLWDHGHIKFWSPQSLGALLREAGLSVLSINRVGRFPPLAKSMVVVAKRPPVA